ncbi:MAG: HAD family hydrolase, partial [Bacteroidota bacterium]
MSNLSEIQGIVFDVFGTLLEIQDRRRPYQRLFAAMGLMEDEWRSAVETVMRHSAGSKAEIVELLRPGSPVPDFDFDGELQAELASVRAFPEVEEVLEALEEKYVLAVISNAAQPYADHTFEFDWRFSIQDTLFSCEEGLLKPEKAIFERTAMRLHCAPEALLMVGDSL